MLTIAILFMISGGLIPVLVDMQIQLEDKKRSMHAAETAYQAVLKLSDRGEREIDGTLYSWMLGEERICVYYLTHKQKEESVCVEISP
ncbi:hypothetical protein ACFOZY_11955 [Chungangia koreensis]|uniref:Uncharacterized protein n=1 Tax=Chungangia koreensis TaxID=752657 RepID=A0ABV8X6T6_9LACT